MAHQTLANLKPGDILCWRGSGPVFRVLSFLLGLFEPHWRGRTWKPWHLLVAWDAEPNGWYILEATAEGVDINFYDAHRLQLLFDYDLVRAYRWLDFKPPRSAMNEFYLSIQHYTYDIGAYFGVALCRLFGLPYRNDRQHMCWETVSAFTAWFSKPLTPANEYPLINRILDKLEEQTCQSMFTDAPNAPQLSRNCNLCQQTNTCPVQTVVRQAREPCQLFLFPQSSGLL